MYTKADEFLAGEPSHYHWEGLYMRLDCQANDIPFAQEPPFNVTEKSNETIIFIHEYIHFLQNFTTNWGVSIFMNFALAYVEIAASYAATKQDILIPFDLSENENPLFRQGFDRRAFQAERLNQFNQYEKITDGVLQATGCDFTHPNGVILVNGLIRMQAGVKVIREHMARFGSYLYVPFSDEQIREKNKTLSRSADGSSYVVNAEYWILFEFFAQLDQISQIGKGVFLLSNYCLTSISPTLKLKAFMAYFVRYTTKYLVKVNLVEFVVTYFSKDEERQRVAKDMKLVRDSLTPFLSDMDETKNGHAVARIVSELLHFSLNNLEKTYGGYLTFSENLNYHENSFWGALLQNIGCGVVRFNDNTQIFGNETHRVSMNENFMFYLAFSLCLQRIDDGKLKECPFLYKFPICKSPFRDSDNCTSAPFEMVNFQDENGYCLFGNAVYLLGLNDRVKSR